MTDAILVGITCAAALLSLPVTVALATRAARSRQVTYIYNPSLRLWVTARQHRLHDALISKVHGSIIAHNSQSEIFISEVSCN